MSSSESTSTTGSPYVRSRSSSQSSLSTSPDHEVHSKKLEGLGREQVCQTSACSVRNIVFVGAGYVGGPTAAVLAYCNPQINVTVVDMNQERISKWRSQHLPIEEPGLSDIVRIARDGANAADDQEARDPNLFFASDCSHHIALADVIYLSVNTPTKISGIGAGTATDISMFESAARSVALSAKSGAIIVEKSTVPCRTANLIRDILAFYRPGVPFEVLSSPEFLAEGSAVNDLLKPSRVLIGSSQTPAGLKAAETLASVYSWVPSASILKIDAFSSELSKLVANAMLAQRISSMNTISAICEKTGSNVDNVALAIGMDPRLGSKFLKAGLGFGGSCFKKDILSLSYLADTLDLPEVAEYWRSVVQINAWQCRRYVHSVLRTLNGSLRGKKITLLGYAFKQDTSDTRETQAAQVVRMLLQEGPNEIAIYDPQCSKAHIEKDLTDLLFEESTRPILRPEGPVIVYTDPYTACNNSAAILILTEWRQFSFPPALSSSSPGNASEPSIAVTRLRRPELHSTVQGRDSMVDHLPTLQIMQVPTASQEKLCKDAGRFRPEPQCPTDCRDCSSQSEVAPHGKESLDWNRVAPLMRHGEKWVFDGRGIVHQRGLESLGFRVQALGKPSTR